TQAQLMTARGERVESRKAECLKSRRAHAHIAEPGLVDAGTEHARAAGLGPDSQLQVLFGLAQPEVILRVRGGEACMALAAPGLVHDVVEGPEGKGAVQLARVAAQIQEQAA